MDGLTERQAWVHGAATYTGDDCLFWPYGMNGNGYGRFCFQGKMLYPHRAVCRLAHGEPPKNKPFAAHGCGQPRCCNPQHLRWATAEENSADQENHNTRIFGELSHNAVLTEEQVRFIRSTRGQRDVYGAMFGVNGRHIDKIRAGTRWEHIANEQAVAA